MNGHEAPANKDPTRFTGGSVNYLDYHYTQKGDILIPNTKELQKQAKTLLHGYGFQDSEIHFEHTVETPKRRYVVDVVGISNKLSVAIELGNCGYEKLITLKAYFDEVIWLPYWILKLEEETKKDLEDKVYSLEHALDETMEQIKHYQARERSFREELYRLNAILNGEKLRRVDA
jgi:hypothetical protein